MRALGETEPMTDANHQYRVLLVTAYAGAYRGAAGHGPPAAGSPARIAARGFPRSRPAAAPGRNARTPEPAAGAGRAGRPRHGPRRGA